MEWVAMELLRSPNTESRKQPRIVHCPLKSPGFWFQLRIFWFRWKRFHLPLIRTFLISGRLLFGDLIFSCWNVITLTSQESLQNVLLLKAQEVLLHIFHWIPTYFAMAFNAKVNILLEDIHIVIQYKHDPLAHLHLADQDTSTKRIPFTHGWPISF